MNPCVTYPIEKSASHSRVVLDNHYGLRFDQPAPNFSIQELTSGFTTRLLLNDNSALVPGIHYLVDHAHPMNIPAGTDLRLLHLQITWDITLMTKILNSIPLQFKRACDILSHEIAADTSFKTFLEIKMQHPSASPPASDLNFSQEELAFLEKDLPKDPLKAYFT